MIWCVLSIGSQEQWEICITDNLLNHVTPIYGFNHNFNESCWIKRIGRHNLLVWSYLHSEIIVLGHSCRFIDVHESFVCVYDLILKLIYPSDQQPSARCGVG